MDFNSFLACLHTDCSVIFSVYIFLLSLGMPESQGKDSESYISSNSSSTSNSVACFGQVSSFCLRGNQQFYAYASGNLLCVFTHFKVGYSKVGVISITLAMLYLIVRCVFLQDSLGIPGVTINCSGFFTKGF